VLIKLDLVIDPQKAPCGAGLKRTQPKGCGAKCAKYLHLLSI
jgi:hypothetical protein